MVRCGPPGHGADPSREDGAMSLEEALIAMLAAVAAVLLFLGLAQALDARPSRLDRKSQSQPEARDGDTGAPSPGSIPAAPSPPVPPGLEREPPHPSPQPKAPPTDAAPDAAVGEDAAVLLASGQPEAARVASEAAWGETRQPLSDAASAAKQIAGRGDEEAQEVIEARRAAMSETYRASVGAALGRRDWTGAHRLIEDGRASGDLSATEADGLVELVGGSLGREAARLVAPVVRGAKDERRAVAGLESAEALLNSMAAIGLPGRHLGSIARRVWRGFAVLGMRKLESGDLDEAASALFRALGLAQIGRQRQRRVRGA